MRAVLRRSERRDRDSEVFRVADLVVDLPRMVVRRGGEPVELTPTEFQLVTTLARRPGRVFTRVQLLEAIGGSGAEAIDRVIDSHVKNVRRKLERDPGQRRYIQTVYGIGYKFTDT